MNVFHRRRLRRRRLTSSFREDLMVRLAMAFERQNGGRAVDANERASASPSLVGAFRWRCSLS
jgi:hypothetical protein